MSNENATVIENGATNGATNGMSDGELKLADAAVVQHKEDETAPHKRKTRGPRVKVATPTTAVTPPVEEPVIPAPQEPETVEASAAPQEPAEAPHAAQESAEASSTVQGPAHPYPAPADENLRLRMKVWTDPQTGKRHLMPVAFFRDLDKHGRPISDVMLTYAVRDDDTAVRVVTMRAAEWQTLPFFYFQEDGPVPRAAEHPVDVLGNPDPR